MVPRAPGIGAPFLGSVRRSGVQQKGVKVSDGHHLILPTAPYQMVLGVVGGMPIVQMRSRIEDVTLTPAGIFPYLCQFDGPFLHDFTGRKRPPENGGAAGAIDNVAPGQISGDSRRDRQQPGN